MHSGRAAYWARDDFALCRVTAHSVPLFTPSCLLHTLVFKLTSPPHNGPVIRQIIGVTNNRNSQNCLGPITNNTNSTNTFNTNSANDLSSQDCLGPITQKRVARSAREDLQGAKS